MTLQQQLTEDAIVLLKQLIATQSFSREENLTGDILEEFFRERNMPFRRKINNVFLRDGCDPCLTFNLPVSIPCKR